MSGVASLDRGLSQQPGSGSGVGSRLRHSSGARCEAEGVRGRETGFGGSLRHSSSDRYEAERAHGGGTGFGGMPRHNSSARCEAQRALGCGIGYGGRLRHNSSARCGAERARGRGVGLCARRRAEQTTERPTRAAAADFALRWDLSGPVRHTKTVQNVLASPAGSDELARGFLSARPHRRTPRGAA
jgi:hypothetical protein